jgi:predicted AlkP superfamily phosphohydrolase/phosphomutase
MGTKILVFGVDAMDRRLILDWIEDGTLPAFASLKERSACGPVTNPSGMHHSALWSNFYTGVGADRNGQYLRTVFDPTHYSFTARRPESDRVPAFWLHDGWQEKLLAVINMPNAQLNKGFNGMQVVEWGVHDYHDKSITTSPPELASEILARFGGDPVGDSYVNERTPKEFGDFRDRLIRRLRAKSDMACHYLASNQWDLFITVLDETHSMGHQCWHLHDPAHPLHDRRLEAELGDPIKDVYVEVDRALGHILELVDDTTTVLFLTDLGMGPAYDGNLVLGEILRRIEGLEQSSGSGTMAILRTMWSTMPHWIQGVARPIRRKFGPKLHNKMHMNERSQRRCFEFPTQDPWGGVRINLVGRESHGLVQPGQEREEFLEHLIGELHQLVDGRSGKPMVAEIVRSRDLDLSGNTDDLPDLIVRWAVASSVSIKSPTVGCINPVYSSRKGEHDVNMTGLFLATGPEVVPGALSHPVKMEDFAPTIASLLEVSLDDTDGAPIAEICGSNTR